MEPYFYDLSKVQLYKIKIIFFTCIINFTKSEAFFAVALCTDIERAKHFEVITHKLTQTVTDTMQTWIVVQKKFLRSRISTIRTISLWKFFQHYFTIQHIVTYYGFQIFALYQTLLSTTACCTFTEFTSL